MCSHSLLTPRRQAHRLSNLNRVPQPVSGRVMARTQSPSPLTLHWTPVTGKIRHSRHRLRVSGFTYREAGLRRASEASGPDWAEPGRPSALTALRKTSTPHPGRKHLAPPLMNSPGDLLATLTKGEARRAITMQRLLLRLKIRKLRINDFIWEVNFPQSTCISKTTKHFTNVIHPEL